jgi:hypothetical protein
MTTALRATAPSLLQHFKRQCCHRCDLGSFDVRLTFIGLLSDDSFKSIRRTSVHPETSMRHSLDFRPVPYHPTSCTYHPTSCHIRTTSCYFASCALLFCVLRHTVLRSAISHTVLLSCLFIRHLFDFRPPVVRPSLDIHLTSM